MTYFLIALAIYTIAIFHLGMGTGAQIVWRMQGFGSEQFHSVYRWIGRAWRNSFR